MTQVIGTFRKGETIALAIDVASGTVPGGTTVEAVLVRGRVMGGQFQTQPGAPAIPMTLTPREASGGIPAGWNATVSAAVTADLPAAAYGAFATFTSGAVVTIDDVPAVIRLLESLPA